MVELVNHTTRSHMPDPENSRCAMVCGGGGSSNMSSDGDRDPSEDMALSGTCW